MCVIDVNHSAPSSFFLRYFKIIFAPVSCFTLLLLPFSAHGLTAAADYVNHDEP